MPIIKHKWRARYNCTCIEKFYYTENGHYHPHGDATLAVRYPKEELHEGRIMLDRGRGQFFVDWSTCNMFKVTGETLKNVREALKDVMDGLRTKSLVADVETWTKIILWAHGGYAVKAAAAFDADGKIVRLAIWDDNKQQFVPKDVYAHAHEHEPFTPERWRQVEAAMVLHKEYQEAERWYVSATHRFNLKDNNLTYLKLLRSMRDTYRKQTVILDGARIKGPVPAKMGKK